MTYTEAHRHYLAALRRDPATPAPALRTDTDVHVHNWKAEMRGYDQARLDLGMATPEQMQMENAAYRVDRQAVRVLRFAKYA